MKNYILVDSSYYIFYRVFALYRWWKFRHDEEECCDLHKNDEFIAKFKELFIKKFEEIPKKLKLPKDAETIFIVGRDCPRKDIWRNHIYPEYKATRGDHSDKKILPGPFFKMVFEEELFEQTRFDDLVILQHEYLEGDDSIAVTIKCIRKNMKDKDDYHIYLIANDADFFQLCDTDLTLMTLAYKEPRTKKNSFMSAGKDLIYKILTGDKSDNIPPVLDKKIKSHAKELATDPMKLMEFLRSDSKYSSRYMFNSNLIDFEKIPKSFSDNVISALEQRFFPKEDGIRIEDIVKICKGIGDHFGKQLTQYI